MRSTSASSSQAPRLELVGQRLDEPRAAERIGGVGHADLLGQDLLRAHRERLRVLGRDRDRLVVAGERERLHAAEHRRERLQRRAHDVVLGLLQRERRAAGLRVRAQLQRARVERAEAVAHDRRPHAPQRAVLGDLLEEVRVRVEDPREPRSEVVDRDAVREHRLDVGDRVGERERHLLHGRGARLAHVVARERDRVEARRLGRAPGHEVGREAQARPRRVDVGAARDVLLEHVVLRRAAHRPRRHALQLGRDDVHRDEHRRGRVDRHRRRDLRRAGCRRRARRRRRASRSPRPRGRPRRASAGRRSRGPSASAGRTRPRARAGPARAGSGSARWPPWPCRSRRTGGSSRGACGSRRRAGRA